MWFLRQFYICPIVMHLIMIKVPEFFLYLLLWVCVSLSVNLGLKRAIYYIPLGDVCWD